MPITEIAVAVIALAVAAVAFYLVPAIIQLKKTLETTDRLVEESRVKLDTITSLLDEDVRSLVNNLNETAETINGITDVVRTDVDKVDGVITAVSEIGDTVKAANEIIDRSIRDTVIEIASYIAGIRAIVESIYNAFGKLFRRKEG